jgi:DNA-binding transcriptional LysR family regulator
LSITHLEYLSAVASSPTWAAAASRVGVTPSALSQGLRELERRLGVTLFERQGRRRSLRAEAAEVVAYAERVLAQTLDLARWAAQVGAGTGGRLRLGMIDAAAVHHFPEAVLAFRHQRPEVDLHLTVAPTGELVSALRQGRLDLAVGVAPVEDEADLAPTHLLDEALYLYAPGHLDPPGQAGTDPAGWGPWVAFPAGSRTRHLVTRALRALGARVEVVAESHQPEVLRALVRLGLGWAVLPAPGQGTDRGPGPVLADPVLWRPLVALRRCDALPHPAADALLDRLVAAARARGPGPGPRRGQPEGPPGQLSGRRDRDARHR